MTHNPGVHDGTYNADIDNCLTQLADVLRHLGIDELSITVNGQSHVTDTDVQPDRKLLDGFCLHINQVYNLIHREGKSA